MHLPFHRWPHLLWPDLTWRLTRATSRSIDGWLAVVELRGRRRRQPLDLREQEGRHEHQRVVQPGFAGWRSWGVSGLFCRAMWCAVMPSVFMWDSGGWLNKFLSLFVYEGLHLVDISYCSIKKNMAYLDFKRKIFSPKKNVSFFRYLYQRK